MRETALGETDNKTSATDFRRVGVYSLQLFVTRNFLLVLGAACLLILPLLQKADIIAASLGACLGGALAMLAGTVIFQTINIRSSLKFALTSDVDHRVPLRSRSGVTLRVALRTSSLRLIWPCLLECRIIFDQDGIQAATHRISGFARSERGLSESLTFPHRGRWSAHSVDCKVSDWAGLFSWTWSVQIEQGPLEFEILPPLLDIPPLPLLSSRETCGDEISDLQRSSGDPLDLKPYHPADGMRRIFWKAFARRGELISRHPENSVTPEGQSMLFCLAGRHEDRLVALATAYLRMLENRQIDILAGCSGMHDHPPATCSSDFEQLSMLTAWLNDPKGALQDSACHFINRIRARSGYDKSGETLLWLSSERVSLQEDLKAICATIQALINTNIRPVVFLKISDQQAEDNSASNGWMDRLLGCFWAVSAGKTEGSCSPNGLNEFAGFCARAGCRVFLIEDKQV